MSERPDFFGHIRFGRALWAGVCCGMILLGSAACGRESGDVSGQTQTEGLLFGKTDSGKTDDPEAATDPDDWRIALAAAEYEGKDNSLDPYTAEVNLPLKSQKLSGETGGGSSIFLGASRAYRLKKHLFAPESGKTSWDELSCTCENGEQSSERYELNDQIWQAKPVAGSDHYLALRIEDTGEGENRKYRYYLSEQDEENQKIREIPLAFLDGEEIQTASDALRDFAMDASGRIHLLLKGSEGYLYRILSPEGETLAECGLDGNIERCQLVPVYDGRVTVWILNREGGERWSNVLQSLDADTGRMEQLAAPAPAEEGSGGSYYTLFDENTLLFADWTGIYRSSLSGENPELLYLWTNHGIYYPQIYDLRSDENGKIRLIYGDADGTGFLCLKPTTEEVDIIQVVVAVSSFRKSAMEPMAAAFNKRYPACHIELKSDYDETALLTQLTAGDGPVLVDTGLTGFEELSRLWQPLDSVMEQLGITEELVASVMETGKINGTLYGVVTDFTLKTLLAASGDVPENWDYDTFLQCVEDRPGLETVSNVCGKGYGTVFLISYLSHGYEDTYLWDAESGTTNFDSDGFRKALKVAEDYFEKAEGTDPEETVLGGRVLCNEVEIRRPEDIAKYRILYGDKAFFAGYPAKDKAAHFIAGSEPLAIRRTASQEEKGAACAFLKFCLSYEGQSKAAKDINYHLSVRKDLLEEQITSMDEELHFMLPGGESVQLGDYMDVDRDRRTLMNLIGQARPYRYFPKELNDLFSEELEDYFDGIITEEMLIDHLESRIGLYLAERQGAE